MYVHVYIIVLVHHGSKVTLLSMRLKKMHGKKNYLATLLETMAIIQCTTLWRLRVMYSKQKDKEGIGQTRWKQQEREREQQRLRAQLRDSARQRERKELSSV